MSNLFDKIAQAHSVTPTKPAFEGVIVSFGNTRDKWFAVTIDQLITTFQDIINNLTGFTSAGNIYDESRWRNAFESHLKDDVARALAGTQTLPYFNLIAKIIHYTSSNDPFEDKKINLDPADLKNALQELQKIVKAGLKSTASINSSSQRITGAENVIYYGAPGTGKTHKINKIIEKDSAIFERTVFHPDMQNSDFVGALKPVMKKGAVTYAFSPGPFAKALKKAWSNPGEKIYLIIEELNRAPAASVFGELFLLLDRKDDGSSVYSASFPNPEFKKWLPNTNGQEPGKITLPSNMWILATMNSADQGVYPLDSAFRRRWKQEYVPLDYSIAPNTPIRIIRDDGSVGQTNWPDFVEKLNNFLISDKLDIQEDRLIGPRFLSENELKGENTIPGKLLIYLWDDLLRHNGREKVFNTGTGKTFVNTYGQISEAVKANKQILSKDLLDYLGALPDAQDQSNGK